VNTPRLIWGVICLVLAAALGVLNIVLPPQNLMFQIGDQNMPWLPAVALVLQRDFGHFTRNRV
jgi:hypothetical protein